MRKSVYRELREEAVDELKRERAGRRSMEVLTVIFGFIGLALFLVSLQIDNPRGAFWIRFPILPLMMVWCMVYVGKFGFPWGSGREDMSEEEIERIMARIYKDSGMSGYDAPLELKGLDELRELYDTDDHEYV